jgi:hypothetical protein
VLPVPDDRQRESLDEFWQQLSAAARTAAQAVAMDMEEPYIGSTLTHLPGADNTLDIGVPCQPPPNGHGLDTIVAKREAIVPAIVETPHEHRR